MRFSLAESRWVDDPQPQRCRVKRGPRGTVECERAENHPPTRDAMHAGRGRAGQWFLWQDKAAP